MGYEVTSIVDSGEEAIKKAEEDRPDLVLMDIVLKKKMNGIESAEQIHSNLDIPHIFITAYADEAVLKQAKKTEPSGYLLKPFDDKDLHACLEIALYRDKVNKKLKENEKSLKSLAEHLPGIVYRIYCRENNRIQFFNVMCEQMTGYKSDELSLNSICTLEPLIHPDDRQAVISTVKEYAKALKPFTVEYRLMHKDGSEKYFIETGKPLAGDNGELLFIEGIITDITDHKKAEEELKSAYQRLKKSQQQLVQADKMTAIGQLAAGISHELNQPLTGIKGFAQTALMELNKNSRLKNDLSRIVQQVDRMDAIIQHIRLFARKADFDMRELDINQPIEDALMLLSRQLAVHRIRVKKFIPKDLPHVRGNHNQLVQAFINLIANARDAIDSLKRPGGGEINLQCALSKDRKHIELIFKDTGCGIYKENLNDIFNPFFTTKSPDGGIGLGLSIVYSVIDNHSGSINVDSKKGKGTTFRITLPVI